MQFFPGTDRRGGVARANVLGVVRLCMGPPLKPPPIGEHNWGRGNFKLGENQRLHKKYYIQVLPHS